MAATVARSGHRARSCRRCAGASWSALRLQARLVRADERADILRHLEEFQPLIPIERHREASETVDRDAALFAHLERHAATGGMFQLCVFGAEPFELCADILVRHATGIANCDEEGHSRTPAARRRPLRRVSTCRIFRREEISLTTA